MININKKIYVIIIICITIVYIGIKYVFNQEENVEFEESLFVEENVQNEVIQEPQKIKIHITGEVNNEGIVELEEGSRIDDAIKAAGDITGLADLSKVNLAYELSDGQKVYIPSVNEEIEEYATSDAGENVLEEKSSSNGKININIASSEELQTISGIGESLANRIIDYRNSNGKFKSVEDLKNVSGIGDKKFEDIKSKIIVK